MSISVNSPLTLPSGLELKNRLVKAAMTECVAGPDNHAHEGHSRLYRRWAEGGLGLQITGNVQVDRRHLEDPANVALDGRPSNEETAALAAWADAGRATGCCILMQISHAGRQTPKVVNERPQAPSPVELNMPGGVFGPPRAMTGEEITATISKFANAAAVAQKAGFDGVQIHAAHGYLISQFLSPIANRRQDEWGGPLENRARLLIETVRAARAATGPEFTLSVKLNSSDFQKGGFSHDDCLAVIDMLNAEKIDLLEVSGGNYEQPKMAGIEGLERPEPENVRESTRAREAYFTDYARNVRARSNAPVMVTGGFRTRAAMDASLEDGDCDLIGLARPLCADPDAPQKLLDGGIEGFVDWENRLRLGPGRYLGPNSPINLIKAVNGWGMMGWFGAQIARMAEGRDPDHSIGVFSAFLGAQSRRAKAGKAYQKTLEPA